MDGFCIAQVPVVAPNTRLVAALPILRVVAVVSKRFCVVVFPTSVPPRIVVVVPEVAPMVMAVATPPRFSVVAFVLKRVAVPVAVVVMSAPLTARSPVTTVLALFMVVVPVAAPIETEVAAPPTLSVVATVFIRFTVELLVPRVAPIFTVPSNVKVLVESLNERMEEPRSVFDVVS